MCKVSKICACVGAQVRDIQQTDLLSKPNEEIVKLLIPTEDDGTEERTKSTYIYSLSGGKCAMLQLNVYP